MQVHTHTHRNHTELCSDTDWWKNMRGWSSIPHITWTTTEQKHFWNVDELLFYTSLIQQNCIDLCLVWLLWWICSAPEWSEKVRAGAGVLRCEWASHVTFHSRLGWFLSFPTAKTLQQEEQLLETLFRGRCISYPTQMNVTPPLCVARLDTPVPFLSV